MFPNTIFCRKCGLFSADSEQDPGPIQGYCEHGDESSIKEGMYSSVECQLSYNRGFS